MTDLSSHRARIGGGYSRGQRVGETIAVAAFFVAGALLAVNAASAVHTPWLAVTAISALLFGALLSDLISGVVHWACDTWGTIETPVLGRLFIRQFREHHTDAQEICRHDFVETNGTNAGLALIPLAVAWALPFDPDSPTHLGLATQIVSISLAFFTTITSQAHKWAHAKERPMLVTWLQKAGLILSPEHHAVHHVWPHRHHYSITGGWVDRWLERFRVFRRCEAAITHVTGANVHTDAEPTQSAAQ